jgi:hypothetical protein
VQSAGHLDFTARFARDAKDAEELFFCFSLRQQKATCPSGRPMEHQRLFNLNIRKYIKNSRSLSVYVRHRRWLFMFSGVSAENMKKNKLCALCAFAVS